MYEDIATFDDEPDRRERQGDGPQPIGEILAELLAQYQRRFPEVNLILVETPAAVA
jgi:DNA-binding transcriptional LysR family regulator